MDEEIVSATFDHHMGEMNPVFVQVLSASLMATFNRPCVIWEPFSGAGSFRQDVNLVGGCSLLHSSIDDYGDWCRRHNVCAAPLGSKVDGAIVHPPYFLSGCGKLQSGLGFVGSIEDYAVQLRSAFKNIVDSVNDCGGILVVCQDFFKNGKIVKYKDLCVGAMESIQGVKFCCQVSGIPDTGFLYMKKGA